MVSDIKSSVIGAIIFAALTIIFSFVLNYIFSSGEIQLFKVHDNEQNLAVITIDSWKLSENNNFKIILYGTKTAKMISSISVYNINSTYDGKGNTILSFDVNLYDNRQIIMIDVDDKFDEEMSKFILYPKNYSIVIGNKVSYQYLTISSLVFAFINGILYFIFNIFMEKRYNKIKYEIDERNKELADIRKDLKKSEEKLDQIHKNSRSTINSIKLILLKRIMDYKTEIDMWRSAVIKLITESGSSKENAHKLISKILYNSGIGDDKFMNTINELDYVEIIDLLDEFRAKKGSR